MKEKRRYSELTAMSGIAILFVLSIHGCGSALHLCYTEASGYADADVSLRFLGNFVSPAVPMFLFVSGYKYAANDTQTSYGNFLKKRLPRVLMSFAILNTLFWLLDSLKYMESIDLILLAKTYMHSWVGYSVAYQLWYIPMYCFVIMLCPLVYRMIPSGILRFCIYAGIGIAQRILEVRIPVLATYPIRFVSYLVFFELGIMAQERDWASRFTQTKTILMAGTYAAVLALSSWAVPAFSVDGLVKYIGYYFMGTVVFFAISVQRKNSWVLQWLGGISYPVFLLHEPLIGRCVGLVLEQIPLHQTVIFALLWVFLTFAITLLTIIILKSVKLGKVLWEYTLILEKR